MDHDYSTLSSGLAVASGAYGRVWTARCRTSELAVAVKSVKRVAYCRSLFTEADMLRLCQGSPYVVKYLDSYEDANSFLMVMELCHGQDLQRSNVVKRQAIKHIVRCLILAVNHMHSRGVAHCDIRHENVVIDYEANGSLHSDFSVKLVDFGSAVRDSAFFSDDLVSIGRLFLSLVTGNRVNDGSDPISLLECPCPSSFSPVGLDLLDRLLSAGNDRATRASDLLDHDWFISAPE